jgi:hypothetical protein
LVTAIDSVFRPALSSMSPAATLSSPGIIAR